MSCGTMGQLLIIDAQEHSIWGYWTLRQLVSNMTVPCAILVDNSLFLVSGGSALNVETMICAQFVIMVINIIWDIDFIGSLLRVVREFFWSQEEKVKRLVIFIYLFVMSYSSSTSCFFYLFVDNFCVKFNRLLSEEYFLVPESYEVLIGNGKIKMAEMVDEVKLMRYRIGQLLVLDLLHM